MFEDMSAVNKICLLLVLYARVDFRRTKIQKRLYAGLMQVESGWDVRYLSVILPRSWYRTI